MSHKSLNLTQKQLELHLKIQQKNAASESMNEYRRPSLLIRSNSTGDVSLTTEKDNQNHQHNGETMLRDTLRKDVSVFGDELLLFLSCLSPM